MQDGKVTIANGRIETRHKLNIFLNDLKLNRPELNIKTQEDAILFAIEEAVKVPALEAMIKELEKTTLSKDEASALYSAVGDVDLWDTETFQVGNKLTHEIKDLKDSEEMKAYVKRYIENINQERRVLNLIEININDVYKILGESYTCFWRIKGE